MLRGPRTFAIECEFATYILIYLPIYSCLLVEYCTEKCLFLGVSKYEKGVGYVYSKSKGRGHDNFFLGNPPVFSFATVRKYPESAPGNLISLIYKRRGQKELQDMLPAETKSRYQLLPKAKQRL